MAPFAGWDMPIQYEGILAEHTETRTACTAFDICHMGEFELKGPSAEADLERLLTQSISSLDVGRCRYGYLLNDAGGVLDDLTCYRMDDDRFMLVVNAATCERDSGWIRQHLSDDTMFTDLSSAMGKIDIQGPTSRRKMEAILGAPLPDLKYFAFAEVQIMGDSCILSRTGYTGEWGYEIYCPWYATEELWNMFVKEGGIKPAGLGARDTLRLEVGYPLYGHELTEEATPVAASRGMFINMDKDFIGEKAVEKDLAEGTVQVMVGLKLDSKRAARTGDSVFTLGAAVSERPSGVVTSGSFAPSLGVAVAMAYIDESLASAGTQLEIDVRGNRLTAAVVDLPFYKDGTARKR